MKFRIFNLILVSLLIAAVEVYAAVSAQVAYKISVTIPAIVGVNVLDPVSDTLAIDMNKDSPSNDILIEETVRNNQPIILKTITTR